MRLMVVICGIVSAALVGYHYGAWADHDVFSDVRPWPKPVPVVKCNERGRTTWLIDCVQASNAPMWCEDQAARIFCVAEEE